MKTQPQIPDGVLQDISKRPTATNIDVFSSRSSRIVTLAKTNPFLPLSLFYVIGAVVIPLDGYHVIYFVSMFILIGILLDAFYPRRFPLWFRKISDYFRLQLQEKPIETITFLGIFCGSLANRHWGGLASDDTEITWEIDKYYVATREAISCGLIVLSFAMFGYKPKRRRSLWDLFRRKKEEPRVKIRAESAIAEFEEREREEAEAKQLKEDGSEAQQHKQWEAKQQERWESWLSEEIERLDGDDNKDRKKKSKPKTKTNLNR